MSLTFGEISLVFEFKVSFSVATPLHPLSRKFTCYPPLPKAVSLHCAPLLIIIAQSLIQVKKGESF